MEQRIAGTCALLSLCLLLARCSSTPPPPAQTDAQKHAVADGSYEADMMLCVDGWKYPNRTASDACLANTRKRWHRGPDGGAQ